MNLDSGGKSMCDRGVRERKSLPEEDIHARTCAVRRIDALSFGRLVSRKVCHELRAKAWICWTLPAKQQSDASFSHAVVSWLVASND